MKFNCKLSKSHIGRPSKPVPVQIGLTRKDAALILVVNHKKSQDKYTISADSIKTIHSKFKKQGKATIEFKNPNFTILISEVGSFCLFQLLKMVVLSCWIYAIL